MYTARRPEYFGRPESRSMTRAMLMYSRFP